LIAIVKNPDPKDPALSQPQRGLQGSFLDGKSVGVMEHCKISNSKHQITNKSQIPILNDQNRFGISNFGHCDLFDICDLLFGISDTATLQYSKTARTCTGKAIEL